MAIEVRGVCTLLLVFDMPTALRFYRDVLGFEIVDTSHPGAGDQVDWCYLRLDAAELMLNAAYEEPERPPAPDSRASRPTRIRASISAAPMSTARIGICVPKVSTSKSRRSRITA